MSFDDIIYLLLLFFSIGFGYYYRTIQDVNKKKKIGTIVGLLIVLAVSGLHILHNIVTFVVGASIILFVDKRKCHLVSFVFCFTYLIFFRSTIYFGIPYPPGHTNLVQMMLTLKLVGLALEVNESYSIKKKLKDDEKTEEELLSDELNVIEKLDYVDIFHYTFNYVGVLTGPYYRYRIFLDSLNKPYSQYVDWKKTLIEKLKYVPMFAVLFLTASYYWPLSYALSDEFYNVRSWLYRYWYIWPNFFIFRMRMYIGLLLSECACVVAGVGVYPKMTDPKAGHGPTKNFKQLKELTDPKDLSTIKYNFETIHNVHPYGADFCITYREGMKHWNICIQYWLAVNVYKKFPLKKHRTLATVMVSAFWHGVYLGYYVCIGTVPIALMVEDVWVKILLKDKKDSFIKNFVVWFYKMNMFSYQAIAFLLLDMGKIFTYYNSIYHAGLILHIILYIIGIKLLKAQKKKNKSNNDQQKEEIKQE